MTYYRDDPLNTPVGVDGNPLPGGPWLRAAVEDDSTLDGYSDSNNGKIALALADQPGLNPGQIAVFVAPDSEINRGLTRSLGLKQGLWVPYSNGEDPKNTQASEFLAHMQALRSPTCPVPMNMGLEITGTQFQNAGNRQIFEIKPATDGNSILSFNAVGGLLVRVDMNGKLHLMEVTPERRKYLEAMGYRLNPNLPVPFSQKEMVVRDSSRETDRSPTYKLFYSSIDRHSPISVTWLHWQDKLSAHKLSP